MHANGKKGRIGMTKIAGVLCLVATGTVIPLPSRAQGLATSDATRPDVPQATGGATAVPAPLPIDDTTRTRPVAPDEGAAPDTGYGATSEIRLESRLADPLVAWASTRGCYRIG